MGYFTKTSVEFCVRMYLHTDVCTGWQDGMDFLWMVWIRAERVEHFHPGPELWHMLRYSVLSGASFLEVRDHTLVLCPSASAWNDHVAG